MLKDKKVFFISILITLGLVSFVQVNSRIYADSQKDGETTIIYSPFEFESENNYKNHKSENNHKIVISNENKKEKDFPKTNEKQNYEIISIGIGIILLGTSLYYLIVKKDHS